MITTIIFDFGGVLFTNGTKRFISAIAKRYNLSEETVKNVIDGEIGSHYREAKISRDEFWAQVISHLHLSENADILEKEWIDGYEMIQGTMDIIEELSKRYSLYYLSDNVKERVDALKAKYKFTRLFKGGIFSHEVGVRKPHPDIYQSALNLTKSKPGETIYIDDKPPFLIPAQKLGLMTFAFTSPEQLRLDLIQEGVLSS